MKELIVKWLCRTENTSLKKAPFNVHWYVVAERPLQTGEISSGFAGSYGRGQLTEVTDVTDFEMTDCD